MCVFFFYLGGILNRVIEKNEKFILLIVLLIVFFLYALELDSEKFKFFILDYPTLFQDGLFCLMLLIVFLKIGSVLKPIASFISGLGNLTYSIFMSFSIQLLMVLFFLNKNRCPV